MKKDVITTGDKEKDELLYNLLFALTDLTEEDREEWRREVADEMPEALPVADAAINCARTYKGTRPISEYC